MLFERIDANIQNYANHLALSDSQFNFTYQDLGEYSQKLIALLDELSIDRDRPIAISYPRSAFLPIIIYSILRAGFSYLFLDPAYPAKRLNKYVKESKAKLLLCDAEQSQISEIDNKVIFSIEDFLNLPSMKIPSPASPPSENAYTIFTSGTTGNPKGVNISRKRVSSYINGLSQRIPLTSQDIYLHTASFSFSSSTRQLFLPLSKGASLYIAGDNDIRNPLTLLNIVENKKITILDTISSLWTHPLKNLQREDKENRFKNTSLNTIIFSGGILDFSLLKEIKINGAYPGKFFNLYGLSEIIGGTAYQVPEDISPFHGVVPAGTVLSGGIYFIDNSNCLHLSFDGMTERLLDGSSAPFTYRNINGSAECFYCTGDLAKELDDGSLIIYGRTDDQVKRYGVRIELSELEIRLKQEQDVTEAIVSLHDDELIAYVTLKDLSSATERTLLSKVNRDFPTNMALNRAILLEQFPRLPNGKIDKKQLSGKNISKDFLKEITNQSINSLSQFENRSEIPFGSDKMKSIFNIWQTILGHENIALDDDFFEIGGDSIKALNMLSEISSKLNYELEIDQLYKYKTIRLLHSAIDDNQINTDREKSDWFYLVQERLNGPTFFWCGDFKHFWRNDLKDVSIYGAKTYFSRLEDLPSKPTSVQEFSKIYTEEIRRIQSWGPYNLGGFSACAVYAYDVARRLNDMGEKTNVFLLDPSESILFNNIGIEQKNQKSFRINKYLNTLFAKPFTAYPKLANHINFHLFERGYVKKMYFGSDHDYSLKKSLEVLKGYVPSSFETSFFLIYAINDHVRGAWSKFLENKCEETMGIEGAHLDLQNNPEMVKRWIHILQRMLR